MQTPYGVCRAVMLLTVLTIMFCANAMPTGYYASSSKLSSGNWAKVEVSESGMQLISKSTLRKLGFNDAEKVTVYGYGGRILQERLNADIPDDIIQIPSLVTDQGIIFFGHSTIRWEQETQKQMSFSHKQNIYSSSSYYFISDIPEQRISPETINFSSQTPADENNVIHSYSERILHENEISAPAPSGRTFAGEDFVSKNSQTFSFDIPGNIGEQRIAVSFIANTNSQYCSIRVKANGEYLTSTTADVIEPASDSEVYFTKTVSVKTSNVEGSRLDVGIDFNPSGKVNIAALDYITVEYPRTLDVSSGELYFYLSPESESWVSLSGVSSTTIIREVTDPGRTTEIIPTVVDGKAYFKTPAGYHEYVAFTPSSVTRQAVAAGKVACQDIHALPVPDMLIISPKEYFNASRRIAAIHEKEGMKVTILTPEQVYNEFSSGTPDVTAFRRLLKMWHDRASADNITPTRYCLLMSRPSYDQRKIVKTASATNYPRIPIWQSEKGFTASSSYSTDDYIGMLDDNVSTFDISSAAINVAVGRIPVKSAAEADAAATKLENYAAFRNPGPWRNSVLVIADDQDQAEHLLQAEKAIDAMRGNGNGDSFLYDKLYLDTYPLVASGTGSTYPEATARLLVKIEEGVSFINYIGHGSAREWGHEKLFTWTDINSLTNKNLPFIFAATCDFMAWDADDLSGAEALWLNPNGGTIGIICPSRKVFVSLNGTFNRNFSSHLFRRNSDGSPLRMGDVMVNAKNDTPDNDNKLRYGYLGDPAMRVPSPSFHAEVTSIAGIEIPSEPAPELKSSTQTSVKGKITDVTGNICTGFNGSVNLILYDAEKCVETLGNGKDGKEVTYNDKGDRLTVAKAKVENGIWSANIFVPTEISGNYNPALLSIYAVADNGEEANGSCSDFYVFGSESADIPDTEGPEIEYLYLDNASFTDGGSVSPSPIVYACFSDISGINIADGGYAHRMSFLLDGKRYIDNVATCFTPDEDNPEKGYIAYPLGEIQPGEHTLRLTVSDNVGNTTEKEISFKVRADWKPTITSFYPIANAGYTSITFRITTDATPPGAKARIEIYDLSGRRVFLSQDKGVYSDSTDMDWNLCDSAGRRIHQGFYVARVVLTASRGAVITDSCKIAVK